MKSARDHNLAHCLEAACGVPSDAVVPWMGACGRSSVGTCVEPSAAWELEWTEIHMNEPSYSRISFIWPSDCPTIELRIFIGCLLCIK